MREVVTGDLIFSFVDTRIIAIGTVVSYCYESPKPVEFGEVGLNCEAIGWRVASELHFPRAPNPSEGPHRPPTGHAARAVLPATGVW